MQRTHYKYMKQGRKTDMTPEKALQLVTAGFEFEVKKRKRKSEMPTSRGNEGENAKSIRLAAALAAEEGGTGQNQYSQQGHEQQLYHKAEGVAQE
mmetsp:Transcript_46996/g.142301  ORF Transcript_46996/g.142301 Transcript_46996/m.142301 type:complete len:95 (+) Transcript_46996:111-395(+)|eukprot:CAMPEP_0113580320 /NCGR_PEP_ID=MMETSP0015_2-20120614/30601_1 /TAXON_ID=2838 /ORGANISM="Odontella" /LENGTH=94 /DNA_ID=CAMNT_0000484483 /DNA_START=67 /DNA_END=351 /DNA_ORIENTATION=- /assembly_acc=CAM_ASM_000160